MLQKICEYTGFTAVTVIGGAPPVNDSSDYTLGVVNWGVTEELVPRNFSAYDPEGFRKNVLGQFYRFLRQTKSEFYCTFSRAVALTSMQSRRPLRPRLTTLGIRRRRL